MQILFDTHIILWAVTDDARLPKAAAQMIDNFDNELYFSAASIWEISIKAGLNRPDFTFDPSLVRQQLLLGGWAELPIDGSHAAAVRALPSHHNDPFGRMLVAQANVEGIMLVTHDTLVAQYAGPITLL